MHDASTLITFSDAGQMGRFHERLRADHDAALDIIDVTPGVRAIAQERERAMVDHGYTPEHDKEHHSAYELLVAADVHLLWAKRASIDLPCDERFRAPFVGLPLLSDIALGKDAAYYATVAGQFIAAALDQMLTKEN